MASRATPVTHLAAERFDRLEAERASLVAKLADVDRRISSFCTRYSDANGYRVRLSPEQVRRAMGRVE